MGPPDPQHPPPPPPPPPQQPPAAKRRGASYADALRGSKVFEPKSQPQRNATPQGHFSSFLPSTDEPAKHSSNLPNHLKSKAAKAPKTGPPQVVKMVPVSELQQPPHAKFQDTTGVKKVPVARSSYAQALLGKKQPAALLLRQQKDNQNHPSSMDNGHSNRPPKGGRKPVDNASKQPQPVVPAAPAIEKMHGKHKGKAKGHHHHHQHHRKPSTEWKRHSSSSVWETTRNETGICTAPKDRGRSFSSPPPVLDPKALLEVAEVSSEPLLEASEVSAPSSEVSEEEQNRLRRVEERARRLASVIEMHDRNELNLWECQYEWDVLIICNGQEWRVHHDIICRESDWFKERLPPKDCNLSYVRFELNNHDPAQIGSALHFMYTHNYPNSTFSRDCPLFGEPLRVNVFKYICGASVNCSNMMRFAFDRINEATDILSEYLPELRHQVRHQVSPPTPVDLFSLYDPLGFALAMMYEQGSRSVMLPLRQAMANLVDNCLMELILNPTFKNAFEVGWVEQIYPNLVSDNIWFTGKGLIAPLSNPLLTTQRTRDQNVQRQVEERLPPPPRYRNKSRDLDGPWRRGDVRLEQPWRHDRTPTIFPARPDDRHHQPIYLPRQGPIVPARPEVKPQQVPLPLSEDRPKTILPSQFEATPSQTAVPRLEQRHQQVSLTQPENSRAQSYPYLPQMREQNTKIVAPVTESPAPAKWGVWPEGFLDNYEHPTRQYSTGKGRSGDGPKSFNSAVRSATMDQPTTISDTASMGECVNIAQQEQRDDADKSIGSISKPNDSSATVVPSLVVEGEADEEKLIDLDHAAVAREPNYRPTMHNNNHCEHDQHDGEEIKRPQSVSGDWENPWDIVDTWRPPQSGKSLSTRPGEEEDERSTITTFTPVTSTAGDDVMCESIVFEEEDGNENENVVVGHDVANDDNFPVNAPGSITTVTKQPESNEKRNEVTMSAAPAAAGADTLATTTAS
ncbi:hypothetical protein QBC38DRAFT_117467 [Podospora fimiseda]|uniref:BTB domain-containing protein n=1 Tax=Podospora fimiseda TaxID=252190 RepID=A0AAN7BF93_9PEZI|nr:hypothetical protein QBC38DRAFT_117467 [Podospora fimiseda]